MKKFKKCFLIVLLIACFAMPLFTGCNFLISSSSKLRTPVVTISESNKSLTWSEISGAESYAIYCNGKLADEIEATENAKTMYDYSATLTETGKYSYYVIATTSSIYKQNSEKSNVCETNYTKKILISPDTPEADIQDENKITFTINDGVISYLPLDIANIEYEVYLYSASSGLKTYPLSNSVLNLKQGSYLTKDEIYAVRLGYSYFGSDNTKKHVIASDIKYYNPDSYSPYTNQIYMFDGYINDYYIENIQELSNIVYYSFVYRLETFNIRISDEFKEFISNAFGYSTTRDNLDYAIDYGFDQLYETIAYQSNNTNGFASQNGTPNEFTIKISYGGVKECDTTISPTASAIFSQGRTTGYYDTINYETLEEKYGETYDDFASDKQFLFTPVKTSEELYWAVENKITPVFEKTNTRAYTIYEKAKQVLREIISDEMTDYEKALSIFDWIAINSEYDYTNYDSYSGSIKNYPTKLPCFYLEGVFVTGNSVCDGFSKSYSLLCNMIGIDCIRIVGDAGTLESRGGHAWNKVLFDKNPTDDIPAKYYLADITWTEMISSDGEEALSHTYFGLSDEQVKDSHFPYKNREVKFSQYASGESLDYYTYHTFDYKDTEENLVIENTQEMQDAFDYLLINAYDTLEIVVDYDYMVSEYNKNSTTGNYLSQTGVKTEYYEASNFADKKSRIKSEYDNATDTMTFYSYSPVYAAFGIVSGYSQQSITYYNYELRNSFQKNAMKFAKFQEQYLFITDENGLMEYKAGKKGMLFVFTQNLLIDNTDANENNVDEVAHLVEYFSDNKITGTFVLYVENPILNEATGTTATQKVQSLFGSALATADIDMSFELVSNDAQTSNASASIFNLTVTEKTA